MKIAIYGRRRDKNTLKYIREIISILDDFKEVDICLYTNIYKSIILSKKSNIGNKILSFSNSDDFEGKVDFIFSVGGDGTLLETINLTRGTGIPVLGINTGRLGFLSGISKDEIKNGICELLSGKYIIDKRSMLQLETKNKLFGDVNYALNELTVLRKDSSSMIHINTYVNDVILNAYWADGLIIATPTGSTGYSLSCGGPIITPGSANFVITPIATHNLSVRPIIVPDDSVIRLEVEGRTKNFLVSMDSRAATIDSSVVLHVKRTSFTMNLVRMQNYDFYSTIRNKLLWGLDIRNY